MLERGPSGNPTRTGSPTKKDRSHLYWTDERIIGGSDPVELGKNNSGHGVGGSMIHYAGYTPRFHPSDFQTMTLDGVGEDWPISYRDLKAHYEQVERELPVAGQDWPWGDPHRYPHAPHPICGAAERAWEGARAHGVEMRVGPVAITNGVFGNRPHCIYRGFCLQGCKANAKASPLITHVPDAIEHGAEIRTGSMAVRITLEDAGTRANAVEYVEVDSGRERRPASRRRRGLRLLDRVTQTPPQLALPPAPARPRERDDQLGRYVMVQGAPQVAGRFPELLRMYKAPPPEVSSEQFYETDPSRGFARGFSIQTLSPLPIGWAEHVLANGHRGAALREYMRDYNHWAVLGGLCELLPLPDNRVTLAAENDQFGMPIARFDYSQCDNDRANIAYAKKTMREIWETAGAQDFLTIDRDAHLVGGCRIGTKQETSVIDSDHRVWEIPNLFVSDGSVMPTQGSANPALTIMALASRLADRLSRKQIRP